MPTNPKTLNINLDTPANGTESGTSAVAGYGQTNWISFGPGATDWVAGDTWTIAFTTSSGDFTVGKGNIAGQSMDCGMKLGTRMFLGCSSYFAFSAINGPTGWEEQDVGAGTISFTSQYGIQDTVAAFAHLQGKLCVFGQYSIQIWQTDADPANFALLQTLDNSGTIAPLSVQAIGDLDVLYLDNTGVRSLRTREVVNNAFVDDIGSAIDLAVRAALVSFDASGSCSVVDPVTKNYWLYLNGNIYVLAHYPASKITAWSTLKATYQATDFSRVVNSTGGSITVYMGDIRDYTKATQVFTLANGASQTVPLPIKYLWVSTLAIPTPNDNTVLILDDSFTGTIDIADPQFPDTSTLTSNQTTFTPEKMVIYNKQIYIRSTSKKIYLYGGTDNNTYDNRQPTVELPWLDLKSPSTQKMAKGLDAAFKGNWAAFLSMNPKTTKFQKVMRRGSASSPSMTADSTFDTGHYPYQGMGTHVKIKFVGVAAAEAQKLGKISFLYDLIDKK